MHYHTINLQNNEWTTWDEISVSKRSLSPCGGHGDIFGNWLRNTALCNPKEIRERAGNLVTSASEGILAQKLLAEQIPTNPTSMPIQSGANQFLKLHPSFVSFVFTTEYLISNDFVNSDSTKGISKIFYCTF